MLFNIWTFFMNNRIFYLFRIDIKAICTCYIYIYIYVYLVHEDIYNYINCIY